MSDLYLNAVEADISGWLPTLSLLLSLLLVGCGTLLIARGAARAYHALHRRLRTPAHTYPTNHAMNVKQAKLWPRDSVERFPAKHRESLRWLLDNLYAIETHARAGHRNRPLIYYPGSGKVRVEFVQTYASPDVARAMWEPVVNRGMKP